jgi:hypothetical protein
MFWYLLLAHFIADYPLQSDWFVKYKNRFSVLLLHAGVHLVTMLVIVGAAAWQVWPYLMLLAGIHLLIDVLKNLQRRLRPQWISIPYWMDQVVHYAVIGGVSWLIVSIEGVVDLPFNRTIVIYALGFLFATQVWFVSERVMTLKQPEYRPFVVEQVSSRMLARACLLAFFLITWKFLTGTFPNVTLLFLPAAGLALYWPYRSTGSRRGLLTDITVALFSAAFIVLTE